MTFPFFFCFRRLPKRQEGRRHPCGGPSQGAGSQLAIGDTIRQNKSQVMNFVGCPSIEKSAWDQGDEL